MGNIFKNWKPALAGLSAIFTALITIPLDATHIGQLIPPILAGLGLIFAKSSSVTGTVANPRAEVAGGPVPPPKLPN